MAIYEYQCKDCGEGFQARRMMKDADAPIACPGCGGDKAKRGLSLFYAPSVSGSSTAAQVNAHSGGGGCGSCGGGSCGSCGRH